MSKLKDYPHLDYTKHLCFDINRFTKATGMKNLIDYLFDRFFADLQLSAKATLRLKTHINVILSNILYHWPRNNDRLIKYARGDHKYRAKAKDNPYRMTAKNIRRIVNCLYENGYVLNFKGFNDKAKRESRLLGTQLLFKLFSDYDLNARDVKIDLNTECVILRDKKKKSIDIPDLPWIKSLHKKLHKYNVLFSNTKVKNRDGLLPHQFARRIYNLSSFEKGGRIYCDWQNEKKEKRRSLLIEGEETIELDFKCIHPNMLYHKAGYDDKSDKYIIPGLTIERKSMKKIINIMLNCKPKARAIQSIKNNIDKSAFSDCSVEECVAMIIQHHQKIEQYFFKQVAYDLQYADSIICVAIIEYFTNKNILVLTLHDSFIVQKKYENELRKIMMKEYFKLLSFYPEIKAKKYVEPKINDSEFKKYLNKYQNDFRRKVVRKDQDGVYKIYGKFGEVGPFNLSGKLAMWYIDRDDNHLAKTNSRRRNIILQKLDKMKINYDLHQDCDIEFGLIFSEHHLFTICQIIEATRKRSLTQEQKSALKARLETPKSSKNSPCKSTLFYPKTDDFSELVPKHHPNENRPK